MAGSCVGVDDAGGPSNPEDVAFTAQAGTTYYIVVDGVAASTDMYTLVVTETSATGCQLVPVELQSFTID